MTIDYERTKTTSRYLRCFAFVVFTWLAVSGHLFAELPYPRFDRLFPLGGAAGSTVEVEVTGADLDDVKNLLFDHPGLKAEPVEGKERRFKLSIAADVPVGTYDVYVVGRFGVSNSRLFAVSHGLVDVNEVEPNNDPGTAQLVELNSAINGTSDQNDQDYFRFTAKQGKRILLLCMASRLDSMLDATITLTNPNGASIASNSDYHGRDSFVDFVVPVDGEYRLAVHDLSYRGGHPYRLVISDLPQIENAWPRVVTIGQSTDVTLFGRNFGGVAGPAARRIGDMPLEERHEIVTVPPDVWPLGAFRFSEHPTDHSTLPTAATCTVVGFQPTMGLPAHLGEAPSLMVTDGPTTVEVEPNNSRDKAQPITLPAMVSGRFDDPRDADWYAFSVPENGPYSVEVYCERINGRADPYVAILDDQGNRVAELDDYGHRINAFDGHLRDPSGLVNLSANRKYTMIVQDRYRRGGARYQYVLSVRKPIPNFYAAAIHHQNPGPGSTTIWRGGAAYVDIIIHQTDGLQSPITVTAEELPAGLHVAPTTITRSNHGTLVFWADEDAAEFTGFVSLIATSTRKGENGDETIRHEVRPYCRVWTDPGMNSSRPMRKLPVAIREKSPFRLRFEQNEITASPGQKIDLKIHLDRYWPEFKNSVSILPLAMPGNFRLANSQLMGEQADMVLPIEVQAGSQEGDFTIAVIGQAQVPFHKNSQEANRPNTLVSLPSQPITIRVKKS